MILSISHGYSSINKNQGGYSISVVNKVPLLRSLFKNLD